VDVPPAVDRVADPHRSPVGGGSGRSALLVAIGVAALITAALLKPWESSPLQVAVPRNDATPSRPPSPATLASSSAEATAGPSAPLNGPHGVVRSGPLDPGAYTYGDVDGRDFNIRFTVPARWAWDGTSLRTGERGEDALITFFTGDVRVYPDPCHWLGPVPRPTGPDPAALMADLRAQRERHATVPVERAALALDLQPRWPGMAIELTVPDNLDLSACDEGQLRSWVLEPERFYQLRRLALACPGQHDYVWAVEILSERLIIDAITEPGTPDHVRSDVAAILRSIVVGHWG
jgi:hypothetical protein